MNWQLSIFKCNLAFVQIHEASMCKYVPIVPMAKRFVDYVPDLGREEVALNPFLQVNEKQVKTGLRDSLNVCASSVFVKTLSVQV